MNNYIVINNNTKLVSNIELATTLPSSSSNEIILNQNDYSDIVGINDLYVSESNTFEKTLIGNFNFEQNDTFPISGFPIIASLLKMSMVESSDSIKMI